MALVHNTNTPVASGSRQGIVIALQTVFILIALTVYVLRLYTRAYILRSTGHDDYIMGLAVVFSIALAVNACISTRYGWGKHLDEVPVSNTGLILLFIWLSELLFTLSTSLVKISVLFFYLRIAVTKTYRRILYISIAFICAWAVIFSAVVIFQCRPVSSYWDPESTQCVKPEAALFIHGLTNTITDVYVFVLPMQMVWKTHLPKRQRIGLLVVFGTGFLVCLAGVLRLYYSITTDHSKDTTWEGLNLWTWESIEVNLAIVCASAPCLKALIARLAPRLMAPNSASSNSQKLAARNHIEARRTAGIQRAYVLESVRETRREGNRERRSGESQESLTKTHEHILIAKVDVDQIV
ncbi:hypothetical protein D0Z07_5732 [Hyphodiscus hymeniophilus]|uniref:Rhodopsin domain-containing protein n=1 Tax=Hyphodiscus hymeniophilus TaxID=353542 RepID=A0A9P6VHJ4_9HELO|nr:hypothetical protein D0Z07_5732 [Hyphodiscus hymeniophilus]